ncbi:type II toxin-antitoxin system VapC family toxin [Roseibium algae]|uniref:Ribonuclease VapC n=1 Tax=Roseibium algae TaxID=3123038 RepID=A0ABU8TRQ7_9HYPH
MMFLLDTNVISELRKVGDGRADRNLVSWISAQEADSLYVSAITTMELEIGVLRMERRDTEQGDRLRAWLDHQVFPEFSERTLAVDCAVAFACARLHVPDPRSERDALIAATALVHNMHVVTRNTSDFELTGVKLINPWEASS